MPNLPEPPDGSKIVLVVESEAPEIWWRDDQAAADQADPGDDPAWRWFFDHEEAPSGWKSIAAVTSGDVYLLHDKPLAEDDVDPEAAARRRPSHHALMRAQTALGEARDAEQLAGNALVAQMLNEMTIGVFQVALLKGLDEQLEAIKRGY